MFERREELEQVLLQTTSQDPANLKVAEAKLMACIDEPFFFLHLAELFMDKGVDEMVRWAAVLFFKNYIERRLQIRSKLRLSDEELSALMTTLISNLHHPPCQLSEQMAVVTARVARVEFRRWPSLLPSLLAPLQATDSPAHDYALLTLTEVLKALASRRLSFDKACFAQLSEELFALVAQEWTGSYAQLSHTLLHDPSSLLRRCLLSLKMLRLLLRHRGSRLSSEADDVTHIAKNIVQCIGTFISMGTRLQEHATMMLLRNKILNNASKFLLEWLERREESDVIIQDNLPSILNICFLSQHRDRWYERVTVNLLNCIKHLIQHRTANSGGDLLVGVEEVEWLLPHLLTSLLPYSPSELHTWSEDEETFISEELAESDHVNLRACVEGLLVSLAREFEVECGRAISAVLEKCSDVTEHSPLQQVLYKDMAYNALGLCLDGMQAYIDLTKLLQLQIIPDLTTTAADYRIVRRRVVWLLGRCLFEEATPLDQSALLTLLTPLLQAPRDLATQFEAVRTLRFAFDCRTFQAQVYQPHVHEHLTLLMNLMNIFTHSSLKKEVLMTVDCIVACMDASKHLQLLSCLLPHLCSLSRPHLASHAVCTTTTVVQKLAGDSVSLHEWLLPLVDEASRIPSEECLWEEGVFLWLATLRCSPSLSVPLLSLFANMPSLLEHGTEVLETLMAIIRAYLCIDASAFMQRWHSEFTQSIERLLREVSVEGEVMVLKLLNLMLVVCPQAVIHLFQPLLIDTLRFVANLDDDLADKKSDLISSHVVLWCRLVLHHPHSPSIIPSLLTTLASQTNAPVQEVEKRMWQGWGQCFEHLNCHKHLKLCAIAMLSLLPSQLLRVEERANQALSVCVDVMHRVCEHKESSYKDHLLLIANEGLVFEEGDDDDAAVCDVWRRTLNQVSRSDHVFVTDLVVVVREGWQGVRAREEFVEYEVAKQLEHLLN